MENPILLGLFVLIGPNCFAFFIPDFEEDLADGNSLDDSSEDEDEGMAFRVYTIYPTRTAKITVNFTTASVYMSLLWDQSSDFAEVKERLLKI